MTRENFLRQYVWLRTKDAMDEIKHANDVAKILSKELPDEVVDEAVDIYIVAGRGKLIGCLRKPETSAAMMTTHYNDMVRTWKEAKNQERLD